MDEPAERHASVAVPTELQEAINEAVTASDAASGTAEPSTLDGAVVAWEAVTEHAAFSAAPALFRAAAFDGLGHALQRRHEALGRAADLDAIIAVFRQALDASPADDPNRGRYLANLASGLNDRYANDEAPGGLDVVIEAWRTAVEAMSTDDPGRPTTLVNLGNRLSDRYKQSGSLADLDVAIEAWKGALDALAVDPPTRLFYLKAVGAAVNERYRRSGAPADLDAVITAWQQVAEAGTADDPDRPMDLTVLGNSLQHRYGRTGSLADLESAIVVFRQALDAGGADSPDRPGFLSNVGSGLLDRYLRAGSPADLQAAIAAWKDSVAASPPGSPNRPMYLNNLAGGLRDRFDRTGRLSDLDETITAMEEALQATPADSPNHPAMLSNLGICLRERFDLSGSPADLEAAITACQQAVDATPADSHDRPIYLTTLGDALRTRYGRTEAPVDLEAAITAHQQAVDATPPDATNRPIYLSSLGRSLRARYRRTREPADLEAAITAYQAALDTAAADAPRRTGFLVNLGSGLRDRYALSGAPSDLDAGVDAFRQACTRGLTLEPATALGAARAWGAWASERGAWPEAVEAYGSGLAAIDDLYQTQLLPGARQTWLADAQGLAASAAFAVARTGELPAAFLVLERGRARLLTEAIQRDRADLAGVATLDPAAHAAYELAARQLRELENLERAAGARRADAARRVPVDALQEQARQARADLEAAVGRIRQLPGRATFGQPPTFDEVARAAEPGCPVVAMVATATGSVALLLARSGSGADVTVEATWASALTMSRLKELMIKVEGDQVVGGYLAAQSDDPDGLDAALADVLPSLGADLIGPVATRLRELNATGVVLMPTGPFGVLPLHAAPYPVTDGTRCLIDEFDVSYTPGARVLSSSRAALAARDAQPIAFVGVGNPQPHPQPLAFARAELDEVVRFFPEAARHTLYETAATESALVALLPGATHVHLACHGRFDAESPLDSCLELAQPDPAAPDGDEGRVRLEEILASDWFGNSRLVVLSACQTAITDARRLPDEAIGLPAGLLQAGVPSVIGTLWSVEDLSTTLLMTQFYGYHRQGDPGTGDGPLPPAAALRRAQGWLRSRTADDLVTLVAAHPSVAGAGLNQLALAEPTSRPFAAPSYWAPFVAIGA
jgi:CHAT domain-containing protein